MVTNCRMSSRMARAAFRAAAAKSRPSDIRALRKRLEHTFFLVPGYGAQGGTADDVRYAFDKYGHGAIVNSSRGIMCAWQKTGWMSLPAQRRTYLPPWRPPGRV